MAGKPVRLKIWVHGKAGGDKCEGRDRAPGLNGRDLEPGGGQQQYFNFALKLLQEAITDLGADPLGQQVVVTAHEETPGQEQLG